MTTRLYFIFCIVLTACNTQLKNKAVDKTALDRSTVKPHIQQNITLTLTKDTLKLDGKQYIQTIKENRFLCLTSIQGDTIIPAEDYYFQAKITDINEDGYKDVRVYVMGEPNDCEDYLFNKGIESLQRFNNINPDIKKLAGTNFYYSYNRVGCGDNSWESHLSKIDNWTEVDIGWMDVHSCGDGEDGIKIYKIIESKSIIVEELPIRQFNSKWQFLKSYWKDNYKIFEQQNHR